MEATTICIMLGQGDCDEQISLKIVNMIETMIVERDHLRKELESFTNGMPTRYDGFVAGNRRNGRKPINPNLFDDLDD